MSRRIRISPELGEGRAAVAPRVAAIMAAELGWSEARCEQERDAYLDSAEREYGVPAVD
jgi:glycerol-3-phosphate dehydrogenase